MESTNPVLIYAKYKLHTAPAQKGISILQGKGNQSFRKKDLSYPKEVGVRVASAYLKIEPKIVTFCDSGLHFYSQ